MTGVTAQDQMSDLLDAIHDGEEAAQTIVLGGEPDPVALERWADAIHVLRQEIDAGRMWAGWVQPTEQDALAARRLVRLIRDGSPHEALVEPARQVYRVTADPAALTALREVLPWLIGGAREVLDGVLALREYVLRGTEPDRTTLDRWVTAVAGYRDKLGQIAGGAGLGPTADDLRTARELVQRFREGAPVGDSIRVAGRVFGLDLDVDHIERFRAVYGELDDTKTAHIFFEPTATFFPTGNVRSVGAHLDSAIPLFERGGVVAGFRPTRQDLWRLRALRDVATSADQKQQGRSAQLAKLLWARLPHDRWVRP